MSVAKNGVTIRTIEDWEKLAPPKSKIHWKDGRSAKEVARAWLEVSDPELPPEIVRTCHKYSVWFSAKMECRTGSQTVFRRFSR